MCKLEVCVYIVSDVSVCIIMGFLNEKTANENLKFWVDILYWRKILIAFNAIDNHVCLQ